jgi:hypothetical protein
MVAEIVVAVQRQVVPVVVNGIVITGIIMSGDWCKRL